MLALAIPSAALAATTPPAPVQLAGGERGTYSWKVLGSRLAGSRPCVGVAITNHHGGPFNYDRSRFRECVGSPTGLRPASAPFVVGGTHVGDRSGMTVFGVLAAGGARAVRATVSDGSGGERVSVPVEPVSARAGRPSGVGIAVIALPGRLCIDRLAIEGAGGRGYWQGVPDEYGCEQASAEALE